jgi:hypothetical protein
MTILLGVVAFLCYEKRITPIQSMLTGILVFISLHYRINYQYLIIYIPIALLLASQTKYKMEMVLALVIAMLPAAWLWITNMPWWFDDSILPFAVNIFNKIGFPERYLNDWVYVGFAGAIMCTSIAYIVLLLTRWHKPGALGQIKAKY